MAEKKNYYEILGVDKKASDADIKAAYRKLVKQYHPDLHPNDPTCAEKFKEINEANEVLSDPQKRQQYDFELEHPGMGGMGGMGGGGFSGFSGGGFGGFSDIFDSFFSGFGGGQSGTRSTQGEDVTREISLSFMDAVKGCVREIAYMRNETCPSCKGTGAKNGTSYSTCQKCKGSGQVRYAQDTLFGRSIRVGVCPDCNGTGKKIIDRCPDCAGKGYIRKETRVTLNIPAGADNNSYLKKRGYGQASKDGGAPGDLIITFRIEPHKMLKRDGNNLSVEVPVSFVTAALGGRIKVPTVDDAIDLDIPAGTQSGTVFELRGKGIATRNGTGNLRVTVNVVIPKKLTRDQQKKLREYDGLSDYRTDEKMKRYADNIEALYGKKAY